ncbi:hypothetical protein N7471_010617 [Penicillium samsonianum]|uniref:uncharacterized protein n=1 Tax=Penicillium samsonianum TaxID=1882272 RepID=UPI0025476B9A|nr:uncharacterized protein N7471_010617 [Penicillium samsonianum]KAJ6126124.1 hypothetical protein N7471_010617 [Penicillium samsonianum]
MSEYEQEKDLCSGQSRGSNPINSEEAATASTDAPSTHQLPQSQASATSNIEGPSSPAQLCDIQTGTARGILQDLSDYVRPVAFQ